MELAVHFNQYNELVNALDHGYYDGYAHALSDLRRKRKILK